MWSHLGDVQETFRWDVLKDSLRMFARKPMLGWGLGAFETVYPAFRSFYTTVYDKAAHNDYVQVLVESGIVGFVFVVWFITCAYRTGLKNLRRWNQSWRGLFSWLRSSAAPAYWFTAPSISIFRPRRRTSRR